MPFLPLLMRVMLLHYGELERLKATISHMHMNRSPSSGTSTYAHADGSTSIDSDLMRVSRIAIHLHYRNRFMLPHGRYINQPAP